MSDGFVGEIRMFGGNFAPRGWANCDGQLMAISGNDALFSLLGTIYGGDGRTTFGLPDMRSRIPVHAGAGPGLSTRKLGAKTGQERVTLNTTQIPAHKHNWRASSQAAAGMTPQNAALATMTSNYYDSQTTELAKMNESMIGVDGGQQSHNNVMPSLGIRFIICLYGIYPSRS